MTKSTFSSFILASLFCFFSFQSAFAVTYFFSGTGTWTEVARWAPAYPGTAIANGDAVIINGTCTLDDDVTLNGTLTIFAGQRDLIIPNGFTLTVNNAGQLINQSQGGTFELGGILDVTGFVRVNNGETLTILATGELKLNNGFNPNMRMHGTIVNNGIITMNNGVLENAIFGPQFNDGLVNKNIFRGFGTISGTGPANKIVNDTTGNFILGSNLGCVSAIGMVNHGKITVEVNGSTACTQFDQITSTGTLTLGGVLETSFNYTPGVYTVVTFIDAAAITGTFTVTPALPTGWAVQYDFPNAGEVSLVNTLVLSVELSSFEAFNTDNNTVGLSWTTTSETNEAGFELERSTDATNWQQIGFVPGNGTTKTYGYEDMSPLAGMNHYRLRRKDLNGRYVYSQSVQVTFEEKTGRIGQFYPNPSQTGMVNLRYKPEHNAEAIHYSVADISGKQVLEGAKPLAEGSNTVSFDFSSLKTGIYIVRFGENGNPVHRKLSIE